MKTTKITKTVMLISIAISATMMSGCTGYKLVKVGEPKPKPLTTLDVDKRITDPMKVSADQIQDELRKLNIAMMSDTKAPKHVKTDKVTIPELNKRISVVWVGDVENAVKSVADNIGWKLREPEGQRPLAKPMVKIDAYNQRAVDILKDIGLQVGRNVGVTLDAKSKEIIVTYLGES